MASEKTLLSPCRVLAIILPLVGATLAGLWVIRDNQNSLGVPEIRTEAVTTKPVEIRKEKRHDFSQFNREWNSYNVSETTVSFYQAQGINYFYARMSASATYQFVVDITPPQVHFERKAILKSDELDFVFGKWTYYETPFGRYKTKIRPKSHNKLLEKIINLDDPDGPVETKRYSIVEENEQVFLKIDIEWGDHKAYFYLN